MNIKPRTYQLDQVTLDCGVFGNAPALVDGTVEGSTDYHIVRIEKAIVFIKGHTIDVTADLPDHERVDLEEMIEAKFQADLKVGA